MFVVKLWLKLFLPIYSSPSYTELLTKDEPFILGALIKKHQVYKLKLGNH